MKVQEQSLTKSIHCSTESVKPFAERVRRVGLSACNIASWKQFCRDGTKGTC